MRRSTLLAALLLLIACVAAAKDPWLPPAPSKWDPKFWESTLQVAHAARDRGDRRNADRLCAIAVPFVETSVLQELGRYADALAAQNNAHASQARANAQRYAEILEMHARATEPGNVEMKFDLDAELNAYAELLDRQHKKKDADSVRALVGAYRQSQAAHINRAILMQQGKDPRGEC